NVYPNPANQVINIASGYDLRKVTLINYVGQTIFAQVVDGNDFQINVSGFVKGMYFVRIETTQGNIVTKPISIQ
ncbi:MAG: T9SS type A sorting domain-containing protein, partial [Bacteroidales bacterium]|nr:T9SS type A sorting domain-containing protein [Bacteroidales bacterium]MDD4740551.1 T9SS type A sorting domain-containing protein [Bacteroidales bacterium]MDY0335069.1 T9SS type A sorting domain-containing protein [Bacteroidales bacterium]